MPAAEDACTLMFARLSHRVLPEPHGLARNRRCVLFRTLVRGVKQKLDGGRIQKKKHRGVKWVP